MLYMIVLIKLKLTNSRLQHSNVRDVFDILTKQLDSFACAFSIKFTPESDENSSFMLHEI